MAQYPLKMTMMAVSHSEDDDDGDGGGSDDDDDHHHKNIVNKKISTITTRRIIEVIIIFIMVTAHMCMLIRDSRSTHKVVALLWLLSSWFKQCFIRLA